jgi:protein arginine kinase activator
MLCEKCGKNAATVYVKNNINGSISESRLCAQCANKNNIQWLESNISGLDLFNALNFGQLSPGYTAEKKSCPLCGVNFEQLVKSGRIGCGECYAVFKAELEPTILKIHGKAKHTGKIPKHLEAKISVKRRIEELNIKLKQMVEVQNFEEAALLRDEIIKLNQEV